jgi:hypothetical protein
MLYLLNSPFYRIDHTPMDAHSWLARVRHDLVKRLCWPARDRRDMGGAPRPGELVPALVDDEGRPVSAETLWAALAAEAPAGAELGPFEQALAAALRATSGGDVAGVLALEAAFETLARSLEAKGG